MRKKSLLIDEYPLLVLPSLAKAIGLNEAIALQQLHYWLANPKGGVMIDGERWVYNTFEDWQKDNFPFWSVRTIMRVFGNLEEMGLVISKQQASYDRKKYYRLHYDKLSQWNMTDCQDAICQPVTMQHDKVSPSLTETTPETTPEIIITPTILEFFIGYFGKFLSEKELHRWETLYETAGQARAKELAEWAFKKEIHLANRAGLLDSLETASKNWKEKPARTNGKTTASAPSVADLWYAKKQEELSNGNS